jgi:rod shape determining protein RodA
MRKREGGIFTNIDWVTVVMYLILVGMGWLNIYASVYNEEHQLITDLSQKYYNIIGVGAYYFDC